MTNCREFLSHVRAALRMSALTTKADMSGRLHPVRFVPIGDIPRGHERLSPAELRHQLQGVASINEREIFCIELAGGKTLDVVAGGSERKIGSKDDFLK
jgi:hypothetical protein